MCKYCGQPTAMEGTGMCDSCWEVEHRLEQFAKGVTGQKYVLKVMLKVVKPGTTCSMFLSDARNYVGSED